MQYLLLILFTQSLAREWVDPHDMNPQSRAKTVKSDEKFSEPMLTHKILECNCSQHTNDITFIYLKKIINLLVTSTNSDNENAALLRGKYFFEQDNNDFIFLKQFVMSEEVDVGKLRQLDSVLNNAFSKKFSENVLDILLTTNEKILNLFNVRIFVLFGLCFALYIFYHLLKNSYSFLYILKYFVFIIGIIDYAFRYQNLLEEAEIHNVNINSEKCKGLQWYEYFFNVDDKCEKKVVSPLEVGLQQLKHVIIIPLSSLGTGTGAFVKELWGQLPFPYNIIMVPFILILSIIFVPAIMTVLNGRSFKINIMHLLHVQFGNQEENGDRVTGPTLNKFLNAVNQRHAVQGVPFFPKKKYKKVISGKTQKAIEYQKNGNKRNHSKAATD